MFYFFIICAMIAVMVLVFHIFIELNELEKKQQILAETVQKHYKPESDTKSRIVDDRASGQTTSSKGA